MKLYGALILMWMVSAVCGLECFSCVKSPPESCNNTMTCGRKADYQCWSNKTDGLVSKGCTKGCEPPVVCCNTDLCNSATPTGSSVLFLLVSSSIITVFL
ncbi:lymphocyte antigen 6B-like [Mugil cephalus]|uniref:lymphocyte antigen 6B-like n=1 Tax=Mugil cephalus TaxID=48193 RepID=UPI001FB84808|nr:lymphocyte antigen 6B-like [Mugil cephalus]